jgi:hypothetical protein
MAELVFDRWQSILGTLDGETVGAAVLQVDNTDTDLIGSMEFLSEVTGWEVSGGSYARQTVELAVAEEDGASVVRYATDPPEFDLTGIDDSNAVVFYDTSGADDDAHEVIFALFNEPGAGFDAWTPDEPTLGLARVRRIDDELIASVLAGITGIDGGTEE